MDKKWFERFSDRDLWNERVQKYIKTGSVTEPPSRLYLIDLWDYFKFSLLTDNRFFFDHPLLNVVKAKISEHVITLPINTTLFRSRIDTDGILRDKASTLSHVGSLTEWKEDGSIEGEVYSAVEEMIAWYSGTDGYDSYREQYQNGFEGFPSSECRCPPPDKVSHGRCNLPNSPHLYVATDIHTAIAETRPYIGDTVSVASLSCEKDLRIVDFCFDRDYRKHPHDLLYVAISAEFSRVNKGNENDYFATQYLTMLVKSLKYDGLRFKSSLVMDGVNYVIFDDTVCKPISSKLYTVVQARYDVKPMNTDFSLKDSKGLDVIDPFIT